MNTKKKNFYYKVEGGRALEGTVIVHGSKNAILPMIAASLIPKSGYTVIKNVPPLNDVLVAVKIARALGADVQYYQEDHVLAVNAAGVSNPELPADLSALLRASVLFLAPLLIRCGKARLGSVGGCPIGERKLDFHYRGFARMGARVEGFEGGFDAAVEQLKGTGLYLDFPSHTGTENLMMAASVAEGTTTIENASSDPEIVDFGNFLTRMGAKINGLGTRTITIRGVKELNPTTYYAMPDRLDAGAFMMAAGITGGNVSIIGAELPVMVLLKEKLRQMGLEITAEGNMVRVKGRKEFKPVNIVTWPYPGFATDFQPGVMSIACMAEGASYFRENVFEDRFGQAKWLNKMGADVEVVNSNFAIVNGPCKLQGAEVNADNIRVGVAMVLAGLAARGTTTIKNGYQIERGHYNLDVRLKALGAEISKISEG